MCPISTSTCYTLFILNTIHFRTKHDETSRQLKSMLYDVFFRWSNTINMEAKAPTSISISKRRPDASVDHAEGNHLQQTFGFGEVKSHSETKNHHAVSMDLIRLSVFSKNATDLGNLKGVLSFQAIGNQVTFYITKLLSDGLYVMLEIGHIEVPRSLRELASYLAHLDDVLNLVHAFHNECGAATAVEETMIEARKRPTMTTPEMIRVVDPTRSRKRPCRTAHYS
ncbi:hypothetical protein [Absidia glauca]|uniref:Uncharacterized protein n=1 Tax=Absidia glauca TaxID=4829 RepID=A0A168TB68_ABSGL|nr:hypothetical protein [Absidia glauca]